MISHSWCYINHRVFLQSHGRCKAPSDERRIWTDIRSIVYLDKSRFTLDSSGVADFFGGAEAASAMATVHVCRNRKQWGWYNSPGSYEIAKRYGLLTKFGFFFGGGHADPAELLTLFELDGRKGPQFLRVHSGNIIPETDHLAAVFMTECSSPACPITPPKGRQPVGVTITELRNCPEDHMVLKPIPTSWDSPILAAVPILASAGTCAMCAVIADWYSFSLILLGIIANGISCLVIGSVKLEFMRPRLAGEESDQEKRSSSHTESHRVSGILITPTNIVLLKGREDAAMAVARGKFVLPPAPRSRSFYKYIGWCSILLLVQFIAQLLLIPQGFLFGQIMFVTSLGASWCYNLWLCSLDKAGVQQKILLENILQLKEDDVKRYRLNNWPAMVVFVLLTVVLEDEDYKCVLNTVLDALVEDTSVVWGIWKSVILKQLLELGDKPRVSEEDLDTMIKNLEVSGGEADGLSKGDCLKLDALLDEARSGIEIFKERSRSVP
ncbi:hypothetical protein J3R82DRAFT_10107 [Butyriboletus roseoflavus]|nr:hypothetical protein J3R82DRAFT_10107 [Butyriboletus roseoflavus]